MNKYPIVEQSMYISKSSLKDGVMKWSAVNSDTDWDLYGERMTISLYHKMLSYIREKAPPPVDFKDMVCSDYWCGGMPYLSLAHYPDLEGKAVPGQPLELFIDGKQLKARGVLFDNALGNAVWKSLKNDENTQNDNKVRISIAFLDLEHKHGDGGSPFKRNSITDVCPECRAGIGDKIYLDGYLVHLALTRVPVNPRTIMKSEEAMSKKAQIQTRLEDAVSIVGEENKALVEEINKSALEAKSDVLVEMSDVEPLVEDAKSKKMKENEDMADEEEDAEKDGMKAYESKKKSLTAEDVMEIVKSLLPAPVVDTVSSPVEEKSALDLATDTLYTSINKAIQLPGTLEQKLESINPAMQELGASISAMVRDSMGLAVPTPASNEQGQILEAVNSLADTLKSLATEVATMKAQATLQPTNVVPNRVPVPRSVQPQLVAQSQAKPANPNSIANIVRRSVSAELPLK